MGIPWPPSGVRAYGTASPSLPRVSESDDQDWGQLYLKCLATTNLPTTLVCYPKQRRVLVHSLVVHLDGVLGTSARDVGLLSQAAQGSRPLSGRSSRRGSRDFSPRAPATMVVRETLPRALTTTMGVSETLPRAPSVTIVVPQTPKFSQQQKK